MRSLFSFVVLLLSVTSMRAAEVADLIIHHAKVVTVDGRFSIAEALAVRRGKIIFVGTNEEVFKHLGELTGEDIKRLDELLRSKDAFDFVNSKTLVIDAKGKVVMPGLFDSHVHPLGAASSEWKAPLPEIQSLQDAFDYIHTKTKTTPEGNWIVLPYAFPTRLNEGRFPTKAELDAVAPKHPVLYHAGPAGVVNSEALRISNVTRDTPNPPNGVVVKDAATGVPTGMLRNAYGVLKGLPREEAELPTADKRKAVLKLFGLYNEYGITSVADRNGSREGLDLYRDMHEKGDLTVRVNVARFFSPSGTREEIAKRLDELPGADKLGGPTGVGDDWVRIGPIKMFLDGGMLNGTAYMREPWPKSPTYQVTEDHYRGLLFIQPEPLKMIIEEAARRKWQTTAHTAGEAAMDNLLDAYEFVNRSIPIQAMRMCITHANFPSQRNLERCKALGVCADVQPAWLYKDGTTMLKEIGKERTRWFQPYRSWMAYTTIGGGSDHMLRFDSLKSTNPWNPWLGIAVALDRITERGTELVPEEKLTREQAVRLYTINNAYLHNEEKIKGSLEVGKLADLIMIDRDILRCPIKEIAQTKTLLTVVGGKIVFERKSVP